MKTSILHIKNNRILQLLIVNSSFRHATGEASYVFRSIFVKTLWPIWAIGITNILSSIGASISFYLSGKILHRYGYKKTLLFEILYNRFINLSALLFPTILSPALMTTTSLTYGVGHVGEKTLLQNEFTQEQRATLGSLASLFGNILFAVMALVIGFIADKTTPAIALIFSNILLFFPLFMYKKIFAINKSS